jgi:Trypsin-like peptidase domain
MIPTNVINRVLHLSSGDHTATGFVAHVDGREYLVTARHFVSLIPTNGLQISHGEAWHDANVQKVGDSANSDVSVLCLEYSICHEALTVTLTTEGLTYGQDVYFLGYPFGFDVQLENLRNGYPMPFVKRATVSNLARFQGGDFWLDGLNNVGFSGGPVVWGQTSNLGRVDKRDSQMG